MKEAPWEELQPAGGRQKPTKARVFYLERQSVMVHVLTLSSVSGESELSAL